MLKDRGLNPFLTCSVVCLLALSVDPMVLGPEISGRLLPHYSKFPNIARLIDGCDLHAQRDCPFVATWQSYTSPGGPLQYVCGADPGVNSEVVCIYIPYEKLKAITTRTEFPQNIHFIKINCC